MKLSRNTIACSAAVAAFSLVGATLALNGRPVSPQAANSGTPNPTAGQKYKNVKVLKDIPADALIPSMQFISASLGVECDFCHVEHAFDKDDKKEKKTARAMMQMMMTINQANFDGEREVTCNTCHRGSPHPQSVPAILVEAPKPPQMAAMHDHDEDPASLPSGDPVLAKFIQALGGEAALAKVTDRVEQGKALMPEGEPIAIDIYTKAGGQRVSIMHMTKGDSTTAYNGVTGWISFPGRPVRELSAADRQDAKLDAEAFYPSHFAHEFTSLKLQPHPEKVGDRETDVVLGITPGQPPVKLYFDKETGLLVRMMHYADTPLGLNPTQVDYADYRAVDGVKTPHRWTLARPSGSFTIQIDKVEQNVPLDDGKFVEPPAPPAPPSSTLK
jgi:photosynthetic reaction center cytochrome c subunit